MTHGPLCFLLQEQGIGTRFHVGLGMIKKEESGYGDNKWDCCAEESSLHLLDVIVPDGKLQAFAKLPLEKTGIFQILKSL